MKRTMKKMLSFGLVAAMSLTMLAGCGNSKDATRPKLNTLCVKDKF